MDAGRTAVVFSALLALLLSNALTPASDPYRVSEGTYLRYVFVGEGEIELSLPYRMMLEEVGPALRKLAGKEPNFIANMYFARIRGTQKIIRTACYVAFEEAEALLNVTEVRGDSFVARVTLTLRDVALVCGEEDLETPPLSRYRSLFEELPDHIRLKYGARLEELSWARDVVVSKRDHEVRDLETGVVLGEWINWLGPWDLEAGATLLLPMRQLHAEYKGLGTLPLVLLNLSEAWGRDYVVGGVEIDRSRTAAGYGFMSYFDDQIISCLSTEVLSEGLEIIRNRYGEYFRRGWLRIVDYGNGTVELVDARFREAWERVRDHKPYRVVVNASTLSSPDGCNLTTFRRLVEFSGRTYVLFPYDFVLVYDRVSGVLLEVTYGAPPYAPFSFPRPLV